MHGYFNYYQLHESVAERIVINASCIYQNIHDFYIACMPINLSKHEKNIVYTIKTVYT
jgi:hypothetical protein